MFILPSWMMGWGCWHVQGRPTLSWQPWQPTWIAATKNRGHKAKFRGNKVEIWATNVKKRKKRDCFIIFVTREEGLRRPCLHVAPGSF